MSDSDKQERETLEDSSSKGKPTEEGRSENSVNEVSQPHEERTPTAEEVVFNSLSGSTQDRIRTLIRERNSAQEQLSRQAEVDSRSVRHDESSYTDASDDEVQRAAKVLKEKAKFVTQDEINAFTNEIKTRIETDRIHTQLETEFDGSDGRPKYDRIEVEDYARKNNIFNLKAAYRDMYFDELQDAARERKRTTYSPKPKASQPQETINIDSFRSKLRGEGGRDYFEKLRKNPQEFDKLLQQLTTADE